MSISIWRKRNMYSPIFHCAYRDLQRGTEPRGDPRGDPPGDPVRPPDPEYIGPVSRVLYRIFPNFWYRRIAAFWPASDPGLQEGLDILFGAVLQESHLIREG
jgi:hypothetical protein